MRMSRRALLMLSAVFILSSTAHAQQARFEHQQERVHRLENLGLLTGPSNDSARAIVVRALRERGVSDATLASLVVVSESTNARTGVRDVRFEQRVAGLWVYDTYVRAALTSSGAVIQIIDTTVAVPRALPGARASAQQALRAALRQLHPEFPGNPAARGQNGNATTFAGGPFFHSDPLVTRVAIPLTDGTLRTGFLVETWTEERNLLNHTLVEGDGTVLAVEPRTVRDSYNVFRVNPTATPQAFASGPAAGGTESPQGWLFAGSQRSVDIAGNNVRAYLDVDANNAADAGGSPVTDGNFGTLANLSQSPSTAGNKNVAAQNLFYLNNAIHDELYKHGFTEAEGNFQENNFGRGGRGSDSVNAEAQDGSGTDNANFATPRDGQNPRMQMFLWTGAGGTHRVVVHTPVAASYQANGAEFGPALNTTGVPGIVALVNDGVAEGTTGTSSDGCEPFGGVEGKIALIDRGTCNFTIKVKNAQNAGAVAAIVANNAGDGIMVMGGTDATITIGSVFIGQNDGAALRLLTNPNATVKLADVQPLSVDGDLDSDIVYHEYGHGLTWRMIGRMSGPISGAIGEGMSDVLAIVINEDDRVAEYSASDPIGIRTRPYTDYHKYRTYGDIAGTGVHFDGEVYGAIGWRLWEIFKGAVVPKSVLLDYLVEGMTFTPAGPKFEHMRDGILSAAAGSGHECHIWQAFAQYGVGVGAKATVKGSTITIVESFDVPAGVCPGP